MTAMTHPIAPLVGLSTNGHRVCRVQVKCPFCGGVHTHAWAGGPDGLRWPTCGVPGASYWVKVGTRERIQFMRTDFATPDGIVGLTPLTMNYCYERDGDDDVIGVVTSTELGQFVLWLQADDAVKLSGQLVTIVENREMLRERYDERAACEC
jgi:hypothetical protein